MATFYYSADARLSSALPAAGAYDLTPLVNPVNVYEEVTFLINYTRGGAGGAVTFKIEYSLDKVTWYQITESQAAAILAGNDDALATQRAVFVYQATGAAKESFTTPTVTAIGNFIRIVMKESGAVGTPGTASVIAYVRGRQD